MTRISWLKTVRLSLSLVPLLANPVHANSILFVDRPYGESQIHAASPIGQTFTAEDPGISTTGFMIGDMADWVAPLDLSIEYRLYAGVGVGGPLLATREVFPLPYAHGWWAD